LKIWVKTDLITTIDHHISNKKELLSKTNVKIMLLNPDWQKKNKPKEA